MNDTVNAWIDDHERELVEDIKTLCEIPSVLAEAQEDAPFGTECAKALHKALEITEQYGFPAVNLDNYVGYADFDPNLPHALDILAHTDVVPAGEGWTVTEPFTVVEKEGRLYGRGTSDDKGPLMCALYAMRAVKECGIPLKKGVRMIIGSDEETGSTDIEHYYNIEEEAPMTFSPDAEFPIINIEKGQFHGTLSAKTEEAAALPRLVSLDAGIAVNAVPQKAVLTFEGLDLTSEAVMSAMAETAEDLDVEITRTGEQEITVIGESAHASTPETGRNAGLAAVILANALPLAACPRTELLKKIPSLFPYGITDGVGLGIAMQDEESGALTCTLDLFRVTPTEMEFTFDARTPLMASKENCEDIAAFAAKQAGFDFETPGMIPPHAVDGKGPFVEALLASYEEVTGLQGECVAIGGGTYVHDLKNGVAFGAILPGIDTRMHGADEFMDIDNMLIAAKVYADAIIRLCS